MFIVIRWLYFEIEIFKYKNKNTSYINEKEKSFIRQ